jgi:hypothetical protein
MNRKIFKRAALCVALGACLGSLAPTAFAQSATGAVAGRATAGDQITITNTATGLTRTVTVGADGSYRLAQLPVGEYTLKRGEQELIVAVPLGGTATVNLASAGGASTLDAVQVSGARVINRVDVFSTETSFNVNREELSRMPVEQSLASVALLAPGVVAGNSSLGGLSFGGSSVAENAIYINGLNVTDMYQRRGNSTAPFAFYKEFQVKTGGYSVEFGRSTGGVINAVSRSGSNEFEGGVEVTFEPSAGKSSGGDHFHNDGTVHSYGSRDTSSFLKTNLWASGPLVKDKLFLFAMYEDRDSKSEYSNGLGTSWSQSQGDAGFWGTKLDWNISDNHMLEVMAFSDESEGATDNYNYSWASDTIGGYSGDLLSDSGGKNWSATYTGHFGQNFTAKAMIGANNQSAFSRSSLDDACNQVFVSDGSYAPYRGLLNGLPPGCHPGSGRIVSRDDTRDVARLDFEWSLGSHLLRFGVDRELMTTDYASKSPGPGGLQYSALVVNPNAEIWDGAGVNAGVSQVIRARRNISGGVFETEANALYVEDIWNVTPSLMLTLGLRYDRFENRAADGRAFIKQDDLIAPRAGFSWDINGDGASKLYGNAGRYYLPVSNNINVQLAGGVIDEYTYFALNGWTQQTNPVTGTAYMAPNIGGQIGPVDNRMNAGGGDLRQAFSRDIEAVYQDEFILGYQQMLDPAWSWGVNATYREMNRTLEDMRINYTECGAVPSSKQWVVGNPGENVTIWGDQSIGCANEGWITIDTSKEGYRKSGSGQIVGYSKPKRTYKALEFQLDRAWDDKWMFNASYLWSKNEGNMEGPVNSDTNFGETGMVQHYDHPAVNERYGYLFNDFRHQFKFRGGFKINEQWSIGSTLQVQSGGPITAFGVAWPDDSLLAGSASEGNGGGSGWLCKAPCGNTWDTRELVYSPRGAFGRLPWTWTLGANVTWTLPVEGIDLKARLSVYNLTNNQTVINVHQRYEVTPGVVRENTFGTGTRWQSPRYTQLVVTWNF